LALFDAFTTGIPPVGSALRASNLKQQSSAISEGPLQITPRRAQRFSKK
jgi:hypothetical protein